MVTEFVCVAFVVASPLPYVWDKLPYLFESMTFGILLLAHQHFQKWCQHWLRLPTNPN